MIHYEEIMVDADFKKLVTDYLSGIRNNNPYKDPDVFERDTGSRFYEDYETFLNKQSKNENRYKYQTNPDCIFDSECGILLRTDQFGFSFKGKAAYDSKYPYGLFFQLVQSEKLSSDNLKEEIEFIAECVNNTRTIGGAFIWPIVEGGGQYRSNYNMYRGVGSYIEDRVDLTLWEIKCFYQIYEKLSKKTYDAFKEKYNEVYEKNILFHYSKNESEYHTMYKFLTEFSTFENYSEFFCFEGNFVRKGKIVDIINSEVSNNDIKYLEDRKNIDTNKKEIRNITKRVHLRRVLENVSSLIIMRSKIMEEKMKKGNP